MRLQDQLQAEIDKLREQEAQDTARRLEEEAFYNDHLLQPMLNAQAYFNELARKLGVVAPQIVVSYPLNPHLADGLLLHQTKHRVLVDNSEKPRQIDVLCSCELNKPHEFYIDTEQAANNRKKVLDAYGLPYHRKNKLDNFFNICGATFILEGPLVARIRITADAAARAIQVEVRNFFPEPEPRNYQFTPDAFGEEMLDKMAKFMLRQVPHLVERKVCDDWRSRLRDQIETEQQDLQRDLEEAQREREAEELARQQATLRYKTREKMTRAAGDVKRVLADTRESLKRWRRDRPG